MTSFYALTVILSLVVIGLAALHVRNSIAIDRDSKKREDASKDQAAVDVVKNADKTRNEV